MRVFRTFQPVAEEQIFVQRVAALGCRASSVEERNGWLLRANSGWTGRANSALPLLSASVSEQSLETVREFYETRNLPVKMQIPLPACGALDEELDRRGFFVSGPTHVLTTHVRDVLGNQTTAGPSGSAKVEISAVSGEEWLEACENWARELDNIGRGLIRRHPRAGFASIRSDEGRVISVGRVVVDRGWAGLSTRAVHPEHRRRGLATTLLLARLRWASVKHGASRAYLQVEKHNVASLALCRKAGFVHHHDYHYRTLRA